MRRFRSLIGKELRQHAAAGLALAGLVALGMLLVLGNAVSERRQTTIIAAALPVLWVFVPLAALVLGNRLVVAEYHARTQIFVEALPIRRFEPVAVKYGLGMGVLAGLALAALGLACLLAASSEHVDARFLAILSARSLAFTWFVWSFAFGMGFTGRFRIPIYIGIGLALMAISGATDLELRRFGPFALVDPETFPTERADFPGSELATTAAVAVGWTLLALVLASIREGSVAETLARRMSQKEKSTIGVLVVVAIVAVFTLQERKQKKPYAFTDEAVLRSRSGPIEVLYVEEAAREDARAVLAALERDLGDLRSTLGWCALPPVRIAYRRDLDARTFETAALRETDGVLVRANFRLAATGSLARDPFAFEAHVVREVLENATKKRASFEPKRWLHDAFSRFWAERNEPRERRSLAWARALWATRSRPLDREQLERWTRYREEAGEPIAEGLASSGLTVLEARKGREAVTALARAVYGRTPPEDLREVFHERAHPMPAVFEETTGERFDAFLAAWNAALDAGRAESGARELLARVPEGRGELSVETGPGDIRTVAYRFSFERPPSRGTVCALVHRKLGPFEGELGRNDFLRDEHAWGEGSPGETFRLAGTYGRGSRAFLALEVESEALFAPLRLAASRQEVR